MISPCLPGVFFLQSRPPGNMCELKKISALRGQKKVPRRRRRRVEWKEKKKKREKRQRRLKPAFNFNFQFHQIPFTLTTRHLITFATRHVDICILFDALQPPRQAGTINGLSNRRIYPKRPSKLRKQFDIHLRYFFPSNRPQYSGSIGGGECVLSLKKI